MNKKIFLIIISLLLQIQYGNASPTIVWSGAQNLTVGPQSGDGNTSLVFDMDNDGIDDYMLTYTSTFRGLPLSGGATITDNGEANTFPLAFGDMIEDNLPFDRTWSYSQTYQVNLLAWFVELEDGVFCVGPWCGLENGYLGRKF